MVQNLQGLCLRLVPLGTGKPDGGFAASQHAVRLVCAPAQLPAAAEEGKDEDEAPPAAPSSVVLSSLDVGLAGFIVCSIELFYRDALEEVALEEALGVMLHRFPLFAGRLRKRKDGRLEVLLNNAGASFALATSRNTLADIIPRPDGAGPFIPKDFSPFHPAAPTSILGYIDSNVPLLNVRLTKLADGGACLAVMAPHVLADGGSARVLLAGWARAYREIRGSAAADLVQGPCLKCADAPAVHSREALAAYTAAALPPGFQPAILQPCTWHDIPRLALKTLACRAFHGKAETVAFHLSRQRLAELKAEANIGLHASAGAGKGWAAGKESGDAGATKVLAALPAKSKSRSGLSLSLVLDLRGRLHPPPPPSTVGNLLTHCQLSARPAAEESLAAVAAAVRQAVAAFDQRRFGEELAWVAEQEAASGRTIPLVLRGLSDFIAPAGSVAVTNWAWRYDEFAFDPGQPPCWHQPQLLPAAPNMVYVVPAPAPLDGMMVYCTLYCKDARQLRKMCAAL